MPNISLPWGLWGGGGRRVKEVSCFRILLLFHCRLSLSVKWIWESVLADNIEFNYINREDVEGLLIVEEKKRNNPKKC